MGVKQHPEPAQVPKWKCSIPWCLEKRIGQMYCGSLHFHLEPKKKEFEDERYLRPLGTRWWY